MLVAVGVVCSITFSVQRLVWAPREAHVSTESRLDKGVYPLAPILIHTFELDNVDEDNLSIFVVVRDSRLASF